MVKGRVYKCTAPTNHPTTIDIAWAAGVYEGEGSCFLQKKNKKLLRIDLGQKHPWILDKLRSLFGGGVYGHYKTPKGKQHFRWLFAGSRAVGFLLTIFTLMSPRRKEQIKQVLGDLILQYKIIQKG